MAGNNVYAKMINGEVYAWGYNNYGQLGIGNTTNQSRPVKIESLTNVDEIYTNGYNNSIYAKTTTGEIYTWGNNLNGQLGIGNTTNQSTPVKIKDLTSIEEIYMDNNNASVYVKTTNGEIYAWGYYNYYGQLGLGTTSKQNTATKIEGITNVKKIYIYDSSVYAKTTDGEVYAWGHNWNGKLGIGNTINQSTPVKIEEYGNTQAIKEFYIRGGDQSTIHILTNDEKIYTWLSDNQPS